MAIAPKRSAHLDENLISNGCRWHSNFSSNLRPSNVIWKIINFVKHSSISSFFSSLCQYARIWFFPSQSWHRIFSEIFSLHPLAMISTLKTPKKKCLFFLSVKVIFIKPSPGILSVSAPFIGCQNEKWGRTRKWKQWKSFNRRNQLTVLMDINSGDGANG